MRPVVRHELSHRGIPPPGVWKEVRKFIFATSCRTKDGWLKNREVITREKAMSEDLPLRRPRKSDLHKYLAEKYDQVFGCEVPKNAPWELVYARIATELQYRAFEEFECLNLLPLGFGRKRRQLSTLSWKVLDKSISDTLKSYSYYMSEKGGFTLAEAVAKKKKKEMTEEQKKYFGPRHRGSKTGMSQSEVWRKVFAENEEAPPKKKKTDAQISEFMTAEFPYKKDRYSDPAHVNRVRSRLNRGAGKELYHQFDDKGHVIEPPPEPPKKEKKVKAAKPPADGAEEDESEDEEDEDEDEDDEEEE